MDLLVEAGTDADAGAHVRHLLVGRQARRQGTGAPAIQGLEPLWKDRSRIWWFLQQTRWKISPTRSKIDRVMKGGKFLTLGYTPSYFTFTQDARAESRWQLRPRRSAPSHRIPWWKASPALEMTVEGVGFGGYSVVRVPRHLNADDICRPANVKGHDSGGGLCPRHAKPFRRPPAQRRRLGFGDRTAPDFGLQPASRGRTST